MEVETGLREDEDALTMNLELEFTLHEAGFFTIKALTLPPVKYELVDQNENEAAYDAMGFKDLLEKIRFERGPKFQFRVVKDGQKGLVTIPLAEWPESSGYVIRVARFGGELKF